MKFDLKNILFLLENDFLPIAVIAIEKYKSYYFTPCNDFGFEIIESLN